MKSEVFPRGKCAKRLPAPQSSYPLSLCKKGWIEGKIMRTLKKHKILWVLWENEEWIYSVEIRSQYGEADCN